MKSENKDETLLNCPMCDGYAVLREFHQDPDEFPDPKTLFYVGCSHSECEVQTPMRKTPEEAIEIWQRRLSPWRSTVEVEVERQVEVFPLGALSKMIDISTELFDIGEALRDLVERLPALRKVVDKLCDEYKSGPVTSASPIERPSRWHIKDR